MVRVNYTTPVGYVKNPSLAMMISCIPDNQKVTIWARQLSDPIVSDTEAGEIKAKVILRYMDARVTIVKSEANTTVIGIELGGGVG